MASEGVFAQNPPSAPVSQSTQPVNSVLHPAEPDSEDVTVEEARAGAKVGYPEAPNPQPPHAPSAEPSLVGPVASSEPEAPVAAQVEEAKAKEASKVEDQFKTQEQSKTGEVEKEAPHPGEKRDLDSTTTSAPALATEAKDEAVPPAEKTEEPEAKKQKLETESEPAKEPVKEPEAPAPAPATTNGANGYSKKAGRPKKDKVKEVIKKAVSTEGIGSRTRSRTKGA